MISMLSIQRNDVVYTANAFYDPAIGYLDGMRTATIDIANEVLPGEVERVEVRAPIPERGEEILTREALAFVAELQRRFDPRRKELLRSRAERQARIDAGELPDFLPETREIRESDWRGAAPPPPPPGRRGESTRAGG